MLNNNATVMQELNADEIIVISGGITREHGFLPPPAPATGA